MINIGTPIRQGDPDHGAHTLGSGRRTIAQAGCLLSCLVMAARAILRKPALGLLDAHEQILAARGFLGSGLLLEQAAGVLGLRVVERGDFVDASVRADLVSDRPVILGIDYRTGASSGQSDADHFVIATGAAGRDLLTADPATGVFKAIAGPEFLYRHEPARLAEMIRLAAAGSA